MEFNKRTKLTTINVILKVNLESKNSNAKVRGKRIW